MTAGMRTNINTYHCWGKHERNILNKTLKYLFSFSKLKRRQAIFTNRVNFKPWRLKNIPTICISWILEEYLKKFDYLFIIYTRKRLATHQSLYVKIVLTFKIWAVISNGRTRDPGNSHGFYKEDQNFNNELFILQ